MIDSDFTTSDSGPWSLGTLIGLPAFLIGIVIAVIVLAWTIRLAKRHREKAYGLGTSRTEMVVARGLASGLLLILVCALLAGFYPYKGEYHQWRNVSGTVAAIDSRLLGTGSGMTERFAVRFEGTDVQFACDDTRCAQVEPGDLLALSCKREWQYTGTDGYGCRFEATEAAR